MRRQRSLVPRKRQSFQLFRDHGYGTSAVPVKPCGGCSGAAPFPLPEEFESMGARGPRDTFREARRHHEGTVLRSAGVATSWRKGSGTEKVVPTTVVAEMPMLLGAPITRGFLGL